ncbi:MAG: copper-translocating P-type ATPase, partial [Deltaproteobacteria bacterium]
MRERGDTCAHCAGSLGKSPVLWEDGEGKVLRFCCPGCLSVYRVIHGAGLSAFYERREGWVPGPPEESDIPIRAFEKGLIRKGDRSEVTLAVGGIRCASCVWLIERFLSGIKGVISARMNFATQRLTLTFDEKVLSLEEVVESIRSLGYVPRPSRAGTGESVSSRERRDLLIRFGTSAFFTMQLMIVTAALYAGYFRGIEETYRGPFRVVALLLATPVLFYGGYPFLRGTLRSLSARALSMDVLIALGACAAYFYSLAMLFTGGEVYFDTAATIVTLILLGRYLESSARVKAEETLEHLTGLIPDTALRVKEGREEEVPLEEINPGDRIRVRAGERIPLDGTISDGSILVDQSHVTGEPLPLLKEAGDVVLGGSLATDGAATVVVTSPAEESTVSRIISLLERVKGEKSPIQRLADRVVGVFVPAVLALAAGTFFL